MTLLWPAYAGLFFYPDHFLFRRRTLSFRRAINLDREIGLHIGNNNWLTYWVCHWYYYTTVEL